MFPNIKRRGFGKAQKKEYEKTYQKVREWVRRNGIPPDIKYTKIAKETGVYRQTVKKHLDAIIKAEILLRMDGRLYLFLPNTNPAHLMQTSITSILKKGELEKVQFVPLVMPEFFGTPMDDFSGISLFKGVLESLFEFARETYKEKNEQLSLQFQGGIDMLYWKKNASEMIAGLKDILPDEVQVVYSFDRDRFLGCLKIASEGMQAYRESYPKRNKVYKKMRKVIEQWEREAEISKKSSEAIFATPPF